MREVCGLGLLVLLTGACGASEAPSSKIEPGGGGAAGGGGQPLALGGSSGSSVAGNAGRGGTGGTGGVPQRADGPPQWLVFDTADGIFAYDLQYYPNPSATIRLGDGPSTNYGSGWGPTWSDDGKYVMDISGESLVVWDMSALVPSEGKVLVTGIKRGSEGTSKRWAADSRTVFLQQERTLYALDAASATPEKREIASNVLYFSSSPQGDGLLFINDAGLSFVRVPQAVPGTPEVVDAINADWQWSPDGVHFGTEGTSVRIFDVSGDRVVMADVFPLMRTYASSPSFSGTGAHFAFNAGNGTEALMYGRVAEPTLVKALNGPVEGAEGRASRWHPRKPLIAYAVGHPPDFTDTGEWVVADVSGDEPSAPMAIPMSGSFDGWLADGTRLLMKSPDRTQLSLIDMASQPPSVAAFGAVATGVAMDQVSPDGKVIGIATDARLYFALVDEPAAALASVSPGGQTDSVPYFTWTADTKYLVVDVTSERFTKSSLRITRMDGPKPGELVTIMEPRTNQGFGWALQRAPR